MRARVFSALAGLCALWGSVASAQVAFLVADRTNDAVWVLADFNGNGVINEPAEVRLWFSAANAAGTAGPDNPSSLASRPDGTAVMGDAGLGAILRLKDSNSDGDAQDAGESRVVADAANASGMSLAFIAGLAFDNEGTLYAANAGNASGPDAVYRCTDLTADGDYQDADEIQVYVGSGAFGPGNGPFGPQEVVFLPGAIIPIGLMRNSSSGLHGVFRFADLSGNGRADDPGEFFAFFDAGNASGITPAPGFALANDAFRPDSVYTLQTAPGSLDQLIRLTDDDGDLTAQQAGEGVVAWETAEPNFISLDVVSLADGRVLVTDSDSDRVAILTDLDGDNRFVSAGERDDFFTNAAVMLGDVRQVAPIPMPPPPACYADCNGVGGLTIADFGCFQTKFVAGDPYADCNSVGGLTIADFGCFQTKFVAGCP